MMRRAPVVLALLFLAACDSGPVPTGPGSDALDPSAILIDATTTGNSHLYFLPPVAGNSAPFPAPADMSLRPRVEICEWSTVDMACADGGVEFVYTTTAGPGGTVVELVDEHYQVDWDTRLEGVETGSVFRASVFLVGLELGSVDFELGDNGKEVKNINTGDNIGLVDGRTLPLKFRIEDGAVEEAEAEAESEEGGLCFDELGNIIDCDIEIIQSDEGGSAQVFEDPGGATQTLAALVNVDPNDAVDGQGDPVDFQLTVQHVAQAPSLDLIPAQQIPFFIDATALDSEGQDVFFQTGALLVLCQPPDLGDTEGEPEVFVPDELHHSLKIFRVHNGVTEILPTTIDDGNCPGGLHGGLNTVRVGAFSGFGATLPTDPSQSTAVVPNGNVGSPTVIEIQAEVDVDEGSLPQIFGGDEVVVTVLTSDEATIEPEVTDNGDGTYTAQYTPTAAGTDQITIEIRNLLTDDLEGISGSPFMSVVTDGLISHWTGDGTFDDAVGTNDGTPSGGVVTFDEAGISGEAFRFQRDGGVVGGPGTGIDPLQELSLSAWINMDEGSPHRAVQRFLTLAGGEKAVIRQNLAPDAGTGRQLHFYMNFGTAETVDLRHLTADGVLQQACFNHVVGTYDGSDMRLYLNGIELRSQAVSGTVVTGDGFHFSNGPTFEGLAGLLDEVSVYDRALTPQEVADLYDEPEFGQCSQPVAGQVVSVDVQPIGPTLITGTMLQLDATPLDAFGDEALAAPPATWSSLNASVATVDPSGMVTAVAPGEAIIVATVDGVSGITRVTVVDVVIDGVMSPGEWPGSAFGFAANLPEGGTAPATFHWQVLDGTFYAAVRFERSALDDQNSASLEFGPDPSGESSGVRDAFLVNGPNSFSDNVRLEVSAPTDESQGGTTDGSGTVANDGTHTTYEMAHPLDSDDDLYDFSLQSGDMIDLVRLHLRIINSGDTGDSFVPPIPLTITIP